jgi:hypothetical protein
MHAVMPFITEAFREHRTLTGQDGKQVAAAPAGISKESGRRSRGGRAAATAAAASAATRRAQTETAASAGAPEEGEEPRPMDGDDDDEDDDDLEIPTREATLLRRFR